MNPKLLTTPFAQDGIKNNIPESDAPETQNATMQYGFPDVTQRKISEGGIPPERADFNGILNEITQNIVHQNKGLGYEFDEEYANKIGGYPLHAQLSLTNGEYVVAIEGGRTNNPNVDMTGWVFDSGLKNLSQAKLNAVNDRVEVWVERFANGDNLTVDAVPTFKRAVDFCRENGLTNLRFNGKYKFSTTTSTWVMPFDDGSLPSQVAALDVHGILPPEAQTTMPVCIRIPANMTITGTNFETCEIRGDFSVADGSINTTQPILFLQECEDWDGTYLPSTTARNRFNRRVRGSLDGFTIRNAFHGYVADGVMFRPKWGTVRFAGCAIPICAAGADSFKADRLIFDSRCMSGLILGGWWQQRSSNSTRPYMPLGSDIDAIGWVDATDIGFMHFGMTPYNRDFIDNRLNILDQYFDTYFWKSANNATRLSTYKTPTAPTVASDIIEYTGIASRALFAFPRQRRTGQQNMIGTFKVYGSTRTPAVSYEQWAVKETFTEYVGRVDSEVELTTGNIYYTNYTDQYHPTITAPFAAAFEVAYWATEDSSIDRHHTAGCPRCPPVGKPQRKVSQKYLSMGQDYTFTELTYDNAKAIFSARTKVRPATSTSDTLEVLHYNITPRLQYWAMPKSNVNDTFAKVTNSGEILDKSVCYGYNAINPTHVTRVRLGSATATTEINITFDSDLYQRSGNVRANIFFTVSAEMLTKSNAAYFRLPDNLPIYTAQGEFGVRNPNFKLIVLPSSTSVTPVRAVITGNSDGQWLSLWKDYAATDAYRCSDFIAEGRVTFVLEYTTNEDLKSL